MMHQVLEDSEEATIDAYLIGKVYARRPNKHKHMWMGYWNSVNGVLSIHHRRSFAAHVFYQHNILPADGDIGLSLATYRSGKVQPTIQKRERTMQSPSAPAHMKTFIRLLNTCACGLGWFIHIRF